MRLLWSLKFPLSFDSESVKSDVLVGERLRQRELLVFTTSQTWVMFDLNTKIKICQGLIHWEVCECGFVPGPFPAGVLALLDQADHSFVLRFSAEFKNLSETVWSTCCWLRSNCDVLTPHDSTGSGAVLKSRLPGCFSDVTPSGVCVFASRHGF